MADRLSSFEHGEMDIGRTIADLRGLLAALERTPETWREQFRSEWGDLEVEYASALDKQESVPTAAHPIVSEAVHNMADLVQERLRLYE